VDSVGGDTLAGLLRTMSIGTSVAACGLAACALNTSCDSVYPSRGQSAGHRLCADEAGAAPCGLGPTGDRSSARSLDQIIDVQPLSKIIELGESDSGGETADAL